MKENSIKNERSSIEEAIKTMERWVEYEKNNKDKINKANELIYIQETVLSNYKRVLKENEKINSLIRKLEKDSEEQQWIQTEDDEYLAHTEKAMYADELLSFLRGEE